MFYLQKQLPKVGRHPLSHSFTKKGQRKKIIDDYDKIFSEIEINRLLSNNRLFQHRYQFQQYIIDVCTNFSEVISAKKNSIVFV
jgi:hypothetical protein